ncbi:MAG: hypothetical protein HYR66_12970 [Sphingobacteriales bacterium]|nr:hypothetical protein [Sphingobacteriales bacterium]MBI3717493.1 hypothetical protein [Sphingobacteriales bacterium]
MRLFKKNISQTNLPDKAANGIANGILQSQRWFANNLDGLTKKWKQKQQWFFLMGVCLIFGGLSITAIVNSFQQSTNSKVVVPKAISIPKPIPNNVSPYLITEEEFRQVQKYKQQYPNLIKERPGLFDSLTLIEQSYYSQKSK